MKMIHKIAFVASLLLFAFTSEAQITSSNSAKNKNGKGQNQSQYTRQQDIQLLEQKARETEKDFRSGNETVLAQHKKESVKIMDREIVRSSQDLSALNKKLAYVPGGSDSKEGQDLQIKIQQMQARYNKQKHIRSNVAGITMEKLKTPREASTLKSQYSQFIDSMKKSLKLSGGTTTPPSGGNKGSSGSITEGNVPNERYTGSNVEVTHTLPESYYRYKDKKEREFYLKMQKNTTSALSTTKKEIEKALAQNKTNEVSKLTEELNERMQTDIQADKKIIERLEKGELKFLGLNGGVIMNKLSKKENIFKKVKRLQLPAHKGQLFSLIDKYIELLN